MAARFPTMLATAGLALALLLSPATAATASAAPECSDVEVVFARGTDEPAGIGKVGKAFVESLRPMLKGKTITTYAVKYPASWDFMKAAVGANDMSKRVQTIVAQCPDTKIVLGGYSQGAAVVDVVATAPIAGLGYTAPLPAAAAPHITSIVVFGNPSARIGNPLTRMSTIFGARTADLCAPADPVCSLGRDWDAHVQYPESGLVKLGAEWTAKLVKAAKPATRQAEAADTASASRAAP
ncbi:MULTISPECIES: cutinase family protein [Mycolicibacterium]|jgi:cutinase|uniref:Cutinase n=1 Tax=Mycolicibacterium neoaurum TaxID=1795 RepID=A0AAV2WT54_MYCNE|nr:cutinase family protein [Mycolicibacterium neoaurum]QVI27672.1 cutinase family protein [Mycolicibacterium neoaurum]TLH59152.1 cutinase family protein [Mycolicibacterium neoaurum]CDQ47053.1 Cutinase [Mycolicibacterium neoaurum]